ncbi:MAG: leucyl/phenylalanyl-tRNA--protein transferase [Fimbriimonadales bacterium]|nr:leucyl/phenylalanyl-tRNA--protein transferase [Fimbriimonadales bacterium]
MRERLTSRDLWLGFSRGAFVYAEQGGYWEWCVPEDRALFFPGTLHVSRSLARRIRKGGFTITFDRAFDQVLRGCADREDTWLHEPLVSATKEAFRQGWAHSCEVWAEGRLVAGIYGLGIGRVFSAESMFRRETDMSKVALTALVEKCFEIGFAVVDTQTTMPYKLQLGAVPCPQSLYELLLPAWLRSDTAWSPRPTGMRTRQF